jgi:hypothetical protein
VTLAQIAQETADRLMSDLMAGRLETIDVDDVARALWLRPDRPADGAVMERLLQLTLRRLVERA